MRRIPLLVALSIAAAACSGGADATTTTLPSDTPAGTTQPTVPAPTSPATAATDDADNAGDDADPGDADPGGTTTLDVTVSPGTEQLTVTGAEAGQALRLVDADGDVVADGVADANGAWIARGLVGGDAYVVASGDARTDAVETIARDDHPDPSFYAEQRLPTDGLGYITTRDGTTLSASVWLPGPADAGPYPTVVEYSGYQPSDPDSVGFPDLFTTLGYAYVGVNIRGTGCSGGSFRYFEYSQSLDGYDAIETVAAQPWVQDRRVGMVGVSYPGISQLFVARTQPPSLAAITPLSVIADTAISTLYPGGILNTGFAVPWAQDRVAEAQPNGQTWAADRIAAGDETCEANQRLRLQNPDLLALIVDNPFWTDEVAAELAPRLFVDDITVPTFLAGAWQDEQTGGHFATMLDRFTGTDRFYATLVNGLHTDSIGPAVVPRLIEFLDLYVAERVPSLAVARFAAPLLAAGIFGTDEVALPATDRFGGMSYEEALAAFESDPPIQVAFEHGAADGFPARAPMARFVAGFDAWPVPEAELTRWHLSGDGVVGGELVAEPTDPPGDPTSYLALPDAVPPTFYEGSSSGIWSVDVEYDWREGGLGTYASWATEPLDAETVVAGSGSVDLYVQSNLGDTDLEVTITEIRPDGQERYVQGGWLRASQRALDPELSTPLRPVQTHRESDAAPLPADEFTLVRVELFPFAHVFREGSRIRLIVDAPGGNRPVWEFETIAAGEQVTIAHDTVSPSSLVLAVVPSVDAPDPYPECGTLRGQPCRTYTGN